MSLHVWQGSTLGVSAGKEMEKPRKPRNMIETGLKEKARSASSRVETNWDMDDLSGLPSKRIPTSAVYWNGKSFVSNDPSGPRSG